MLDLDNIESDEYSRRLKLLDGLKSALRTQSLSFVERFIELDGLTRLLEFLLSMNTGKVYRLTLGPFKRVLKYFIVIKVVVYKTVERHERISNTYVCDWFYPGTYEQSSWSSSCY